MARPEDEDLEPTSAVAKRMLELLLELPELQRRRAMQNVVRDLEQHDLLQYSPAMASPWRSSAA